MAEQVQTDGNNILLDVKGLKKYFPIQRGLLRRVVGKIFGIEIKGWCSEFEARNASGGETLAKTAG